MKNLLYISLLAVAISLAYSQTSFAVCVEGPPSIWTCTTDSPNPDPSGVQLPIGDPGVTVTMIPGSAIDTVPANGGNSGSGIQTTNNNDQITVTGASINTNSSGISSRNGIDIINVTDSVFTTISDSIDKGFVGGGVMNITGSTLLSTSNDVIEGGGDDDVIFVSHSTLTTQEPTSEAIDLNSGDDELTLGTGVVLNSIVEGIDCGEGFDTIIFAMDVPEEAVGFISSQILQAGLPDGSITINGLFYEWEECELLVPQLNGVRVARPIPTLSEWGLIAMVGVLGLVGLLAIRRRKVTA